MDDVAGPHSVGGNDVALLAGGLPGDKGKMGASVGVVFNPLDDVLARSVALEVDGSDPPPVTTSSVSDGDLTAVVTASLAMTNLCKGELGDWLAFPEVVVDWPAQPSGTGCPWFVGLELELGIFPGRARGRAESDGACSGGGRGGGGG